VLAVPVVPIVLGLATGSAAPDRLLHPTGEFAARFMIAALMISPLRAAFPQARWRRRSLGVAAFGYAALHTLIYLIDMATLRNVLAEFFALGIWTGWAAFAVIVPLAVTSNEASMRRLGASWPRLHHIVYAAAILTLLHWVFVHNNLGAVLAHFVPLALLEGWRLFRRARSGIAAG
jgi:sulfoxide reductase heme-binding subunit YedZ